MGYTPAGRPHLRLENPVSALFVVFIVAVAAASPLAADSRELDKPGCLLS